MSGDDRQNSPSISRQNRPSATLNSATVSKVLGVSPSSAYELMHEPDFPVLRVGSRMVVPKEQFIQWVMENTEGGVHK